MTGSPSSSHPPAEPRLKIQGLSVSVNYADFLECIAPNIRHFDRWLVVTDEKDTRTIDVCKRWGLDVLISQRLYENDAAFHKAAALNEGLEALDQDAWVAVMDSDILLPSDFRERLEAQNLDPACLYGLGGRRICQTVHEFRAVAAREPWVDNLIFSSFVIGYFNLFHQRQSRNRYPEHGSDDASTYDVLFSDSFPVGSRRCLPFVCLHAGVASLNWRGRTVDPFFQNGTAPADAAPDFTGELAVLCGGPEKTVAQIGCYHGALTCALAQHFSRVIVIDHWGLNVRSAFPALATDLRFLADRYAAETAELTNITPPLEHCDATLAQIPDHSVDVIWLTAEPEYDFLLHFLPAWVRKLKPGGAIAGGFYEPERLPGPSSTVNMLIGVPDEIFPDMQWLRRIRDPQTFISRQFPPTLSTAEQRGVVYVSMGEEDVEGLLVSLSSLQRHWQGSVSVVCAGDESPSLRIACARLGIDFRSVPCFSAKYPDDLNRLHALEWSPFEESVFISAHSLILESPQFLFDALDNHDCAFCPPREGSRQPASMAAFGWRRRGPGLDAWRAIGGAILGFAGPMGASGALGPLVADSAVHFLPAGKIWSGPSRRVPRGTAILSLDRLGRAGALHLHPEWAEEEKALLSRLGRGG